MHWKDTLDGFKLEDDLVIDDHIRVELADWVALVGCR
jgi:hypothetical protein